MLTLNNLRQAGFFEDKPADVTDSVWLYRKGLEVAERWGADDPAAYRYALLAVEARVLEARAAA